MVAMDVFSRDGVALDAGLAWEQTYLPRDFGARVRAAIAYWGGRGGLQAFAAECGQDGMSAGTMRKWIERDYRPRRGSEAAIVKRLAEVSGLPEEFFTGQGAAPQHLEARLAHIEAELQELLEHKRWAERNLRGYTPEEASAFFRLLREMQSRLGREVGVRDPQDRAVMDRHSPRRADADG